MKKRNLTTDDALRMMKKIGGGGGIAQETDPTVPAWAKQPTKPTYTADEVGALPNTTKIPSKTSDLTNDSKYVTDSELTAKGYAKQTEVDSLSEEIANYSNVSYGTCSTVADTAEKVVTIDNENWELKVGAVVMVQFTTSNSASNVKLNVNGTGAYPIWYNNAEYTSTGTAYTGYANRVIGYMFNGTHWVWIMQSYDSNTTYTNVKLGHGYVTCATAEATKAKVGTLSSYTLTVGGIVAVKFTYGVPASATLNINSKGAKAIYFRGAAITAGIIKAGDIATFIYNGSQYHLLSIDRWQNDINSLAEEVAGLKDGNVEVDLTGYATEIYVKNYAQPKGNYASKSELTAETIAREQAISDLELQMNQQNLTFVSSEDEMTDPKKLYVYDGYIYQYGKKTETIVTPGQTITTPAKAALIKDKRYSLSGGAFSTASGKAAIVLPLPKDITGDLTVTLEGILRDNSYGEAYGGITNNAFTAKVFVPSASGDYTFYTLKNSDYTASSMYAVSNYNFVVLCVKLSSDNTDFANAKIAINGVDIPIVVTTDPTIAVQESTTVTEGSTETVETEGFYNTGVAFAPADYEARIIALENKIGTVDENAVVHNSIGTVFPPSQKPADADYEGYDIDIYSCMADDVYDYIDEIVSGKATVTKEVLGKDTSGQYDIARYIYANREHIAWQRQNYPKMYAWKNGSTVIYSTSISPRIGDTMYSTSYVGTAYSTVTAVNATNRSRTANNLEFVRYESGDVEPTIIYTDLDDKRNSNSSITKNSIIYNRYPLGDLGANKEKLIPIFIYANEHGQPKEIDYAPPAGDGHEGVMPAVVASRFIRDLASDKQAKNLFYKFLRENCMLIIIPVANPYGFNYHLTDDDNGYTGYYNVNHININRNYDTPGWDALTSSEDLFTRGDYVGSENETQYIMNSMVESGAVVAMSLHGMWGWKGYVAHQGQNPNPNATSDTDKYVDYNQGKLAKVGEFLQENWGYTLRYYDMSNGEPVRCKNTPDVTSKSPSYISQCGAYGGIVEFTEDDIRSSEYKIEHNGYPNENAYAQMLNLMAMWLSDYLEQ